ncbi:P-loop containing nucleoside triphosphate hydrolase protein [Amylocystis lapponica]|nr:P-loop containing nucleoside triphosphate hydrolase protein [Amylocystis lapponica]
MATRRPASIKQKKDKLQLKRAVKRGDVAPPPSALRNHRRNAGTKARTSLSDASAQSARRLQSSFLLSSTLPLIRPIPDEAAILSSPDRESESTARLTCLKRPKWRYDMSKEEVEKNEQGLFQKWLAQTDAAVDEWCSPRPPSEEAIDGEREIPQEPEPDQLEMPRAPTSFERNLEVWRQLWRVTEISQILLVLLDSRCPILHYPPSLHAYLSSTPHLATRTRTILVLTKVDISGPARAEAWTKYLYEQYPGIKIVQVESYAHTAPSDAAGKARAHAPYLPSAFRQTLVDTLRAAHSELLEPPERIKDQPEKVSSWKPSVKRDVDWDAVLKAEGGQVGTVVGGPTVPRPQRESGQGDNSEDEEEVSEFLTIGVIGQPNVGKSSLLNALFGTQKVKASRTPGKTKHFQTLFWTPEVRLVDCPGLVMPNFTPMETQVLSGILPISRVSAVPFCIHHAAQLLPLERIYNLAHPSAAPAAPPPPTDKRTWRAGMHPHAPPAPATVREPAWTAMDVLVAYAHKKGWLTAMAGRPDVHRAGNASTSLRLRLPPLSARRSPHVPRAVLLALAEGRVRWAFWPPGTDAQTVRGAQHEEGAGIWMPRAAGGDEDGSEDGSGDEAEGTDASDEDGSVVLEEDEGEDTEDGEGAAGVSGAAGRFGALVLDDVGEASEDE